GAAGRNEGTKRFDLFLLIAFGKMPEKESYVVAKVQVEDQIVVERCSCQKVPGEKSLVEAAQLIESANSRQVSGNAAGAKQIRKACLAGRGRRFHGKNLFRLFVVLLF